MTLIVQTIMHDWAGVLWSWLPWVYKLNLNIYILVEWLTFFSISSCDYEENLQLGTRFIRVTLYSCLPENFSRNSFRISRVSWKSSILKNTKQEHHISLVYNKPLLLLMWNLCLFPAPLYSLKALRLCLWLMICIKWFFLNRCKRALVFGKFLIFFMGQMQKYC